MQRTPPFYDPDGLRDGVKNLDSNIDRLQKALEALFEENTRLAQKITKNREDMRVYQAEIGKLEQQKADLHRLIVEIEAKRH